MGFRRGAFFQCEVSDIGYSKPTGMLTNVDEIFSSKLLREGWPQVCQRPGADAGVLGYFGPLPPSCFHGGHRGLIGPRGSGGWATASSAAYPPDVCTLLGEPLAKFLVRHLSGRVLRPPPSVGSLSPGVSHFPHDVFPDEVLLLGSMVSADCEKNARSSHVYGLDEKDGILGVQVSKGIPVKEVNEVITTILRRMGAAFFWSSCQINVNTIAGWHVDPVAGMVFVIVGGSFEGGDLVFESGVRHKLKNQAVIFHGAEVHKVEGFTGRRWSIAAYNSWR